MISLFFSILYTSPLLAVDYVYDKTKLTDDEITRLKKLRDRNSEYWKEETYHIKSNNRVYPNIPALFPKHPFDPFENINNSKRISFYDKEYTEDYLVGFAQGLGVAKRNGETEKPIRQYFKECLNTGKYSDDTCKSQQSIPTVRSDIFALNTKIKNSHINSEILSVGNYIEWLRPTLNQLSSSQEHLYSDVDPFHYIEVTDNSHVIGQTISLDEFRLENSLWEPRWDSDVGELKTTNADIRFNTKSESLLVKEDYAGGARFRFAYGLKDKVPETPVLTFEKNITGTSDIIFENPIDDLKSLDGHQIIKVNGTADKHAFRLSGKHQKGIYTLSLQQRPEGFFTKVQERDDISIYAQQAQAANTLFALRLNDKNSDIFDRTLPRKGLWLRVIDGHSNQWVQGKTAPVESNRKGVQLGGEVFTWQNESNQLSVGLMSGQAEQRSTFRNPDTDNLTTGNVKGFGAGIYATWHQLQDKQTGAYADSWVQYQRFRHRINTEDATERFTSKGITASIEAGYNALLAEHFTKKGNRVRFYLQPQAQLTYLGVNGKFSDSENAHVNLLGSRQLQSRVGVQAKAQFSLYKNIAIEPFAAVNALYHNKPFGVEMDGERRMINNKTAIESQLGVAVKIKSHLTLQATFNRQTGKHHQAKQGALNLQWTF
ncbi:autotransporter outer membrane beta-barrel domain-containing protein [Neisseria meningitidis]|uniref:autotransporter outer membrane beta-barrel domain-containing protein n=1 Tax=Neisseria meningitidis TaxID=487 RepID=UPI001641E3CC|nr:autotransporter outer membrane beta-barrel domain-containing protein [Neisseria meningitidis]MCL4965287.1 autotransporter outer membrane beta-barrel domain-containing protein [Neisseria meningitidis]QPR92047.1 autotransporter outer membrane beta-barrel domain-containing protein [Neisseria meningitidis]UON19296.1 autotransporter outer membrane beta-barrel domain-containing protein [Neisseria meningitidis]